MGYLIIVLILFAILYYLFGNNTDKKSIKQSQSIIEEYDFQEENELELNRLFDMIENRVYEARNCEDPDDTVDDYEDALSLLDQLKSFCYDAGSAGINYYDHEYASYERRLRGEFQNFLNYEYQNALAEYESIQSHKEKYEETCDTILELIKSSDICLQKELYKHFDPADKNLVLSCLNHLIQHNRVKKEKYSNTNKLTLS